MLEAGSGVSALMVDVEVDRPVREFFRGPRCVSLNSVPGQLYHHLNMGLGNQLLLVKFQDMMCKFKDVMLWLLRLTGK